MRSVNEELSDDQLKEMISMADIEGTGSVNYEEFVRILSGK